MNENLPLVSVICLCYNHSKFVVEAMESVLNQSYPNVELIVVDDASTDNSVSIISNYLVDRPKIKFIGNKHNVGNCKAFNLGWLASSGDFIIDLAADDLMLPDRIVIGVDRLLKSGVDYGVHFSDAKIINEEGAIIKEHRTQDYFSHDVPEGIIFEVLLSKYFINPVTMMYSRALLDDLGGYDESLAYEDFDLWVRSSKKFKYCYENKILMAKRVLTKSHGAKQYKPGSKILPSTYVVCEKAFVLCENIADFRALEIRLRYEMKMAIASLNWRIAIKFFNLLRRTQKKTSSLKS